MDAKQSSNSIKHSWVMAMSSLLGLLIILAFPTWYDTANHKQYQEALSHKTLVMREYRDQLLPFTSPHSSGTASPAEYNGMFGALGRTELIAVDYVHKLEKAGEGQSQLPRFIMFAFATSIIATFLIWRAARSRGLGAPLFIALAFLFPLACMYLFGLPHVNYKFHAVIGTLYALLLALGHLMLTLKLPEYANMSSAGHISALQYRHRFWTTVYNISFAAVLALAATVTFQIRDSYLQVFGESYMERPLLATLATLVVAILWIFVCIIQPVARHLGCMEGAMSQVGPGNAIRTQDRIAEGVNQA